jgi:predicted anti-sigma-YlaC factor YlaD
MNCDETPALLIDRLKGLASAADHARLDAHLLSCPDCRAYAEATAAIWERMDTSEEDVPHERLRARFHAGLAAHEAAAAEPWLGRLLARWWPRQPALQAALAASLLLAGVQLGQRWPTGADAEIAALRDEVRTVGLALLDHQSASERLLGVEWSRRAAPTPTVVAALLERVRYDSSLSVRLAAVDALRTQLDRAEVSEGLAATLDRPLPPLLQVALADALLASGTSTAAEAVRATLTREDLDPAVRDYLQTALAEDGADTGPEI